MNARPLTEQIERAQLWLENGYKPVPCLRHDAPEFVERRNKSGKLVKVEQSPGKQPQGWLWSRKERGLQRHARQDRRLAAPAWHW